MKLPVEFCISCGARPKLVSLAILEKGRGIAEIYRCSECNKIMSVCDGDGRAAINVRVLAPAPNDDEKYLLKELFVRGQVWDDQLDRKTRTTYRRLEALGLVECRTLVNKRSFWAVSIRGLKFLGKEA